MKNAAAVTTVTPVKGANIKEIIPPITQPMNSKYKKSSVVVQT